MVHVGAAGVRSGWNGDHRLMERRSGASVALADGTSRTAPRARLICNTRAGAAASRRRGHGPSRDTTLIGTANARGRERESAIVTPDFSWECVGLPPRTGWSVARVRQLER